MMPSKETRSLKQGHIGLCLGRIDMMVAIVASTVEICNSSGSTIIILNRTTIKSWEMGHIYLKICSILDCR